MLDVEWLREVEVKRRWRLIALVGLLAVLGGVSGLQHRAAYSRSVSGPAEVAIVQAASWPVSDADVEAAVRQAVALAGGLDGLISDGDTVVVKPNLVWNASPEEGAVTDPRVVRAVVQLARGPRVPITVSPTSAARPSPPSVTPDTTRTGTWWTMPLAHR
jgi:hypothetical protein